MSGPATTSSPVGCHACGKLLPRAGMRCPACGAAMSDRHPALAEVKQVGSFTIAGELGRGGMGHVYEAHDERLKRQVALKALKPRFRDDARSRLRFIEEARITGQLEHPGIVPVYTIEETKGGDVYFCMKLISGRTLARLIELWHDGDRAVRHEWSLKRLVAVFERVVETVAFAHSRGVLHRDLKPANVMIGDHGEVWVLDWGLAKALSRKNDEPSSTHRVATIRDDLADGLTVAGRAVGTPFYMPPEQALGAELDERADVFALGATLYEILTARAPIAGKTTAKAIAAAAAGGHVPVRQTRAGRRAPAGLAAITEKCLMHDANHRYASARALLADLRAWSEDRPVSALPERPLRRVARIVRRHATAYAVGSIALIALLTASTIVAGRISAKDRIALKAQVELQREADARQRIEQQSQREKAAQDVAARKRVAAYDPYARGMDLILRGVRFVDAADLLARAVAADPSFVEAHYAYGEALRQSGKPAAAAEAYLRADEAARAAGRKGHLQALLAAGFAYDGAGEYERSEDVFARAAREGGDDPLALVGKAMLLTNHGEFADALPLVERAVRDAPWLWEAHYGYATVLCDEVAQGLLPRRPWLERGIAELRAALAQSPRQTEVIVWLATELMHGDAPDEREAAALIDRAIELEPSNGSRYTSRAIWRLANGGDVDADLARARELGANANAVILAELLVAAARGDAQRAYDLGDRLAAARRGWPMDTELRLRQAIALGRADAVAADIAAFATEHPRLPAPYALQALAAEKRHDDEAVERAVEAGLAVAPHSIPLHELRARSSSRRGEWSRVLVDVDAILDQRPRDVGARLGRSVAFAHMRRMADASAELDAIAAAFPERGAEVAKLRGDLATLTASLKASDAALAARVGGDGAVAPIIGEPTKVTPAAAGAQDLFADPPADAPAQVTNR